eukprot:gene52547-62657_t
MRHRCARRRHIHGSALTLAGLVALGADAAGTSNATNATNSTDRPAEQTEVQSSVLQRWRDAAPNASDAKRQSVLDQ